MKSTNTLSKEDEEKLRKLAQNFHELDEEAREILLKYSVLMLTQNRSEEEKVIAD